MTKSLTKIGKRVIAAILFALSVTTAQAEELYIVGKNLRFGNNGSCLDTRGKPVMGLIRFKQFFDDGGAGIGECGNGIRDGIFKLCYPSGYEERALKGGRYDIYREKHHVIRISQIL